MKRSKPKVFKPRVNKDGCFYCKESRSPDYKGYEELRRFVTDRARIVGRGRTGLCSKHQRRLTREIKRARHLGLMPFSAGI